MTRSVRTHERACRRSTAPAVTAWAGPSFSGDLERSRVPLSALELLSSLRLLQQRARASGPCRPRSAATRASASSSRPADACTSRVAPYIEAVRAQPVSRADAAAAARCTRSSACVDRPSCRTSTIRSSRSICSSSKHVLVAPGSSFNVPYRDHFRITNLGATGAGAGVCAIEELLESYAAGERPAARHAPDLHLVEGTR